MTTDEKYMLRCLELASCGIGEASPNPSVGCVIVHEEKIIGEGFTSSYGGNHAEVNAVNSVERKELLVESTVYVSLEPCAHYGKTPPCADLLVSSKVKRVVIGCQDPFAKVNGAGIERLRKAGIEVEVGSLESECRQLNRRFFTFYQKKRPYVILKWAETKDGFVDHIRNDENQKPLKITSDASSTLVHKWRAEEASILVGKNTVIADNPSLTSRKYAGKNPVRIVLGNSKEYLDLLNVFNSDSETLIFSEEERHFQNSETIIVEDTKNLNAILTELYKRDILSVLVEGGPTVHSWFFENNCWDEVRRFVTPNEVRTGIPALKIGLNPTETLNVGIDKLHYYRNR